MAPQIPRTVAALLAALSSACHEESTTADFTAIDVVSELDGMLPASQLQVSGRLESGEEAFPTFPFALEALAAPPARRKESLFVGPLPASLDGALVHVEVGAFDAGGAVLAAGADDLRLRLGLVVTASVVLIPPSACGDGARVAAEGCDDGNTAAGDGCDERCEVERGFVCALDPSRCFDRASTVFADADAACSGDGSEERPFCTLEQALNAPRAAAVIVRPGLYREQAAADRARVEVIAEPGAVLESEEAPALRVFGGSIVAVVGLVVRGRGGSGGGVVAEGAGTSLEVEGGELGPGGAIGVEVRDRARLRLERAVVRGNAGGGVKLDSSADHHVANTIVAENGSGTSRFGGVWVAEAGAASRIVNTTVVENVATASAAASAAGITCDAAAAVDNSIVWGNQGGAPVSLDRCRTNYSDLGPFTGDPGPLDTNFSADPLLGADLHLSIGSPCIDRGDPTGVEPAGVAPRVDIDGEPRPRGARVDVGADEAG